MAQSLAMASTTLVLNDFGELTKRQKQLKSGKLGAARYSATISATPMKLKYDAKELGKKPADAIAKHLRERVSGIHTEASAATLRLRATAAKSLASGGNAWRKNYAPTKQSSAPPNQTPYLFNDSGRLAKGIVVGAAKGDAWIINVPAIRFNAALLGGEDNLRRVYNQLVALVPEFGDARKLRDVLSVRKAIKDATKLIDARLGGGVGSRIASFLNQDISLKQVVDGISDLAALAA